jgi:hypothetical protein
LFVTTPLHAARLLTPHHGSPPLTAPQFNSTICLFLFASRHGATLRGSVRRSAALRNATQRFVCQFIITSPRFAARFIAALFNATQRFVCYFASLQSAALRNSTRLSAALLSAIQLNDLFVNLLLQRAVLHCSATLRAAARLTAAQLNDLFVNLLSRLDTALGNEPRRNSPCRDAQQLNATN